MGLLTDEAREALRQPVIQLGILAELDFRFDTERYWTGTHPLDVDGYIFLPTGKLGRVTGFSSSTTLQANGVKLSLSVPFEMLKPIEERQNVVPADYKNRQAKVMIAVFDESFQRVIYKLDRYYHMDNLDYQVDPSRGMVINLHLESEILSAGKKQIRRYTDVQQRDKFPGDLGLQFLTYLASDREVRWGSEGAFFK